MREMTLEQALNALQAAELRIVELEAEGRELRASGAVREFPCTMGVGSGDGRLFMHGDRDSIKAAQSIVLDRERLAGRVAELETENQKLRAAGQTLAEAVPKLRAQQAAQDAKLDRLTQSVAGIHERSSRAFMSNTELARKVCELEKERDSFRRDAERWRKLRDMHWSCSPLAVVQDPKKACHLGSVMPSGAQLDEAVDAVIAIETAKAASMEWRDKDGVLMARLGRFDDADAKEGQQ